MPTDILRIPEYVLAQSLNTVVVHKKHPGNL